MIRSEDELLRPFWESIRLWLEENVRHFSIDSNRLNKVALRDAMQPNNGTECMLPNELRNQVAFLEANERYRRIEHAIDSYPWRWLRY